MPSVPELERLILAVLTDRETEADRRRLVWLLVGLRRRAQSAGRA